MCLAEGGCVALGGVPGDYRGVELGGEGAEELFLFFVRYVFATLDVVAGDSVQNLFGCI